MVIRVDPGPIGLTTCQKAMSPTSANGMNLRWMGEQFTDEELLGIARVATEMARRGKPFSLPNSGA